MQDFIRIPKGALIGSKQQPIYGYETVKATLVNGLAVRKSLPKEPFNWTVCHASSGLRVDMLSANTKERAIQNAFLAASIGFDWNLTTEEVIENLRKSPGFMEYLNIIYRNTLDA